MPELCHSSCQSTALSFRETHRCPFSLYLFYFILFSFYFTQSSYSTRRCHNGRKTEESRFPPSSQGLTGNLPGDSVPKKKIRFQIRKLCQVSPCLTGRRTETTFSFCLWNFFLLCHSSLALSKPFRRPSTMEIFFTLCASILSPRDLFHHLSLSGISLHPPAKNFFNFLGLPPRCPDIVRSASDHSGCGLARE